MAALYPEERFVAVEKNDSAAGIAAKKYDEEGTDNLLLIWNDARFIDSWFAPEEVDVIHLNFSDPWPKNRNAKRRRSAGGLCWMQASIFGAKTTRRMP